MGDSAYRVVRHYADQLKGAFVEIGSESPREYCEDGFGEGSTRFFAGFCKAHGLPFYSVDFEQKAYEQVSQLDGVAAYCMRGEDFLEHHFPQFHQQIAFAYLDNFDWSFDWTARSEGELDFPRSVLEQWESRRADTYSQSGLELNNANSQRAHLDQAILVNRYAAERCIILLDDTWKMSDGSYSGKGGTAIPYLLSNGFEILHLCPLSVSLARGIRRSVRAEMELKMDRILGGLKKAARSLPAPVYQFARDRYRRIKAQRAAPH